LRTLIWLAALAVAFLPCAAGARPVVAIVDSGVAKTAELAGVLAAEYDEAGSSRTAFQPHDGHGTMVATILNRAARGGVDIVSLRIDDARGCPPALHPPCQSDPRAVARAIDHATALGVDAINLSLALADDPAITAAVARATKRGIIVVMAAGNNGRDHPDNLAMARQGYPLAVLVGATDEDGKPWAGTNRPEPNETGYAYVWQPGVSIPTVDARGVECWATGTSFAAPVETARRVLAKQTPAPMGTALAMVTHASP
jgi:subtilisin family serine protease